ncbi:MAG: formyltetrahydrofolate deformylase [Chloroflexota bacterium]|nr:formyltetrahydrofolate deformylase [Chloroflexota bacterium]
MTNGDTITATLLISCPDRQGLVAAVTGFIAGQHGNILHLDQHVDAAQGIFFMRVEWDISTFTTPREQIAPAFATVAAPLGMTWELHFSDVVPRMAIFVSKQSHCLYDLLSRWQSGEWRVDIPLIVSNHRDLAGIAAQFGIRYAVFPMEAATKAAQEAEQIALLRTHNIDFVVLARYMQIVSPQFIEAFPRRVINIHHSFLPAFIGDRPYHKAYERGVKMIGATSHYVTAELDAGPIIDQDIVRVDHRDSIADMIRKGRDIEKLVLARAVRAHLHHRVLVYHNKTVVFG